MKRSCVLLLLCALLLTGCGSQASAAKPPAEPVSGTVFAMDTVMDLTIYAGEDLLAAAEDRIAELESKLSVTDPASEIYALNQTGSGTLSPDTAQLLGKALELCRRSGGRLDLSVYPVLRAWGFTTGSYAVPDAETLAALLQHVDYTKIDFDEADRTVRLAAGMEIDLGSVAKGYTGDQIAALLRDGGAASALLNLGGNVQALGAKPDGSPWRVAVQDPQGDGYIGVVEVTDQAVITSGGYERYFEEDGQTYWHIIDPATGAPARSGLISVTIVGDSGLLCDGLSTALFVMGLDEAADFWRESQDFEAIFVSEGGSIAITEGLENRFSLADGGSAGEVTVLRRD